MEIGERALAKIERGKNSHRRQALASKWQDAIWVGVAERSNEHIVLMEGGGPAVRCRTLVGASIHKGLFCLIHSE